MSKLQISRFRTTAKEFAFDGCHKFYIFEDDRVKKEMMDEGWEEKEFYPIKKLPEMFNKCSCALRFIDRCTPNGGFQTIVPQFQNRTTFSWVNCSKKDKSIPAAMKKMTHCTKCACELVSRRDGWKFCIRCGWTQHEEVFPKKE